MEKNLDISQQILNLGTAWKGKASFMFLPLYLR
jgi:hypothetical protein